MVQNILRLHVHVQQLSAQTRRTPLWEFSEEFLTFRSSLPVLFVFEKLIEAFTFVTFGTSNGLLCQKDLANLRCRVSFLETLTTSPSFSLLFSISKTKSALEIVASPS
jgi:hypothetical protein